MISMLEEAGAAPHLVEKITHNPPKSGRHGGAYSGYSRTAFSVLQGVIERLRLPVVTSAQLALPFAD